MSNISSCILITAVLTCLASQGWSKTCPKDDTSCHDRALIAKRVEVYKQACTKKTANKIQHLKATRMCDAYLSYLIYKRDKTNFTATKGILKKMYIKGCDVHKDAMSCGTYVSRGSNKLTTKQIKADTRFKSYKKRASQLCAKGDASLCASLLYLFPNKKGMSTPIERASIKTLVIKYAQQTCKKTRSYDGCLPALMAGTYKKNWSMLKALCTKDKIGAACQLYGDGIKGNGQAWYERGCALSHDKSCQKKAQWILRRQPKKARILLRKTCKTSLSACIDLARVVR